MPTNLQTILSSRPLRVAILGAACLATSFLMGIQTASDVHPFSRSEAAIEGTLSQTAAIKGDVNGNGVLELKDAISVLEFAEALETPTQGELRRGDVDGDFRLTAEDALRILRTLANR